MAKNIGFFPELVNLDIDHNEELQITACFYYLLNK